MAAEYPQSGTGAETDPVAEGEKGQPNGIATLDGTGQVPLSQLGNAPTGGGGGADASTTVKGISKLSVAPASPTNPVAAGDNDPRLSDQRVPTDASVTAAKVNGSLKPSGTAAAGTEALRALGTGSTQAAAGDDSRFPTAGQKNALAGTSGTPGTTNQYVTNQDSRLSDARTPTAHAASHASAGSDPVTVAESQVTNLVSDLAAKAPLASPALTGTPTVPTATQGTNTTQVASTQYVQTETGLLIPKSLVDAKGDLLVGTADNTVARKAVGANGKTLIADSAQSDGLAWRSLVFRTVHTFAVKGSLAAADSTPGFFVSLASGQSVNIVKARYVIASGTNATFKIQKNGADLTGYGTTGSPLTATTVAAETVSTQAFADNDFLDLVLLGVSGSPTDVTVTLVLEHTITGQ